MATNATPVATATAEMAKCMHCGRSFKARGLTTHERACGRRKIESIQDKAFEERYWRQKRAEGMFHRLFTDLTTDITCELQSIVAYMSLAEPAPQLSMVGEQQRLRITDTLTS